VIHTIKKKNKRKSKIQPIVVNDKSKLQDRLFNVGWEKVQCRGLEIVVEEISTGNRKTFNYVSELEDFIESEEEKIVANQE